MIRRFSWLLAALFGALLCSRAATQEAISFNLQVRPILSDRCWACHGPDENKRKAKLRLDTKEGALASKDGKFIIKPGDPEASEVYKRLISSDPDEKMPPADSHLSVSSNEIDRFILARLEKEGLKPAPEAPKERLLRRITFDLTGLPPTPAEIDSFLADSSTNAFEKVVDRLLASESFGERIAVDWLDLAR